MVNGGSLLNARIQGFGSEAEFSSPYDVTLQIGDTVDFVIGNGGNGFTGDTTGIVSGCQAG